MVASGAIHQALDAASIWSRRFPASRPIDGFAGAPNQARIEPGRVER